MSKADKRKRKKDGRKARIEAELAKEKARRRRRLIINIGVLAVVVGLVGYWIARPRDEQAVQTDTPTACVNPSPNRGPFENPPPSTIDTQLANIAKLDTSMGKIEFELAVDEAPKTANSFSFLASQGFYDGLSFHRIVDGFVIQGGDPQGDGTGGSGYKVTEAPPADLKYTEGVVAMAKGSQEAAGTSGSQFFIVSGPNGASLTPEYALLGRVTEGMDVVEKIQAVEVNGESPIEPVTMDCVVVEAGGQPIVATETASDQTDTETVVDPSPNSTPPGPTPTTETSTVAER